MQKRIMVWNCRGAGSEGFRRGLKLACDNNRPNILGLLETRIQHDRAEGLFRRLGYGKWLISPGLGFFGGIWIGWREEKAHLELLELNEQFVHLSVSYGGEEAWKLTVAYVTPRYREKQVFWDHMARLSREMEGVWIVIGDLNDIRRDLEKQGGAPRNEKRCTIFNDNIDACNLLEVETWGSRFTWKGPLIPGFARIYERLDRALCNIDWRTRFPEAVLKNLVRLKCSNHCPILLCLDDNECGLGERPFRFEAAWLLHEDFRKFMEENWRKKERVRGSLELLKPSLVEWNTEVFKHISWKKNRLLARIGGIQRKISKEGRAARFLSKLEDQLQGELEEVLKQEEILWFQKSRGKWINDGDRNTKYYYLKTLTRRRRNKVAMLKNDEGQWIDDQGLQSSRGGWISRNFLPKNVGHGVGGSF
ncbi:uncharacterized protein LOC114760152 [Neltuma alba]|uniref:uncharacterized protein LOC114760152 n=1 Tax=Neltuma alba TaxID=207710 RepID=UPI0010A5286C|nr:uncharacterized protein LOC114760152 [Prosopis alba]